MRVSSQAAVYLQQGKVAVKAEGPAARGFIVRTQGMCYTDLGASSPCGSLPGGGQELARLPRQGAGGGERNARSRERGAGSKWFSTPRPPLPAPRQLSCLPIRAYVFPRRRIGQGGEARRANRGGRKQFVRTEQVTRFEASRSPEFALDAIREKLCRNRDLVAYYDFQPDAETSPRFTTARARAGCSTSRIEGAGVGRRPLAGQVGAAICQRQRPRAHVISPASLRGPYRRRLGQRSGIAEQVQRHSHVGQLVSQSGAMPLAVDLPRRVDAWSLLSVRS